MTTFIVTRLRPMTHELGVIWPDEIEEAVEADGWEFDNGLLRFYAIDTEGFVEEAYVDAYAPGQWIRVRRA